MMSIVQGIDGNRQQVSVLMASYKVQHNETRIIGLNVMKDTSDVFDDVKNNLQCSSICVFFLACFFLLKFSLSVLLPAKTEMCLDSLIPGLEPPQAQLHPVEAEPASLALAGKKCASEIDEPQPCILTPSQINK